MKYAFDILIVLYGGFAAYLALVAWIADKPASNTLWTGAKVFAGAALLAIAARVIL